MQTECASPENGQRSMAESLRDFEDLPREDQLELLKNLMKVMKRMASEREDLLSERDSLLQETMRQREEMAGLRARLRVLTEF